MKKIVVCIVLLLSVLSVNAQSVDKFMLDLSKEHNAENVNINGFLFTLMKPFIAMAATEAMPFANKIKSMHVVNLNIHNEDKQKAYISRINNLEESDGYVSIIKVKDGEENIHIMARKEKDKIKSLCVFCVNKHEISAVKLNVSIKDEDVQKMIAKYDKKQ